MNGESLKGDGDNGPRSGLRPKGPSAAAIQEKEAKLRQILSCRKAAPIVSTAPSKLFDSSQLVLKFQSYISLSLVLVCSVSYQSCITLRFNDLRFNSAQ